MIATPIAETQDDVTFQLDTGIRFRVSLIDKTFVFGQNWTVAGKGYIRQSGQPKKYLHDLIARRAGFAQSEETDHRDLDRLNNRRDNLRPASSSENKANVSLRSDNTSGFKGVSWWKDRNKWRADGMISKKQVHLGTFDTAEAASEAYSNWAEKTFGEFARS